MFAICWVSVLTGCPVDTRRLQGAAGAGGHSGSAAASPASGGATTGGGGSGTAQDLGGAGESGSPSEGGGGGAVVRPPILVEGCADLDADRVSDCQETLAVNANFNADVTGWTADAEAADSFTTTLTWAPMNAWGSEPSGSALIRVSGAVDFNGSALRGASQCLGVGSSQLVIAYGNALVDPGQDPAGDAELDVSFFDTADCTGASTGSFSTPPPLEAGPGGWLTLQAGSVSSVTTRSALLKLGVSKPFRAPAFQARFDNVLVKVQSP